MEDIDKAKKARERQRLWRLRNPEKAKERERRWKQNHPDANAQKTQRYRMNHPDRVRESYKSAKQNYPGRIQAHKAVYHALKSGKLKKPESCDLCHEPRALQGHHEDYAKPLDVIWVCSTCHKNLHIAHPAGANNGNVTTDRKYQGEIHHEAKLTNDDVISIRARFAAGGISKAALGREYGVTDVLIGMIIRRKAWVHIQ